VHRNRRAALPGAAPLPRGKTPPLSPTPGIAMRGPRFRRLAGCATAALVLAACGSGASTDDNPAAGTSRALPSVSVDSALAAKVPAAIASDGRITVGTDSTYAPSEFVAEDGETIVGFDVDLFTLVAAKLGLKATFETSPFDSIIAGVGSGKYEAGVSSFTVNADREAQANMVSYFSAGTQWAAKKDNPKKVHPESACGLNIAVQKATVQVDDITARSTACTDAGKPAITIDQYDAQSDATAAVVSGKDDAGLADSPVMAYAVTQTRGGLELLGDVYDAAPYGYVVAKDQAEFAQVIADAVAALIADGTYQRVLKTWGVEGGAVAQPALNPRVG
jgi:polar amino acid transport system substrate-binding protein